MFSWHGVLLAEVARIFSTSMQGTMNGGVLSFGQLGGLALPFLYSAVLGISGNYQIGLALLVTSPFRRWDVAKCLASITNLMKI